jgi:hypothetical protein
MSLDCDCPKCNGEIIEPSDFTRYRCLNREHDLEIRRMQLDMKSPFDWLLSPYLWLSLAVICGIINWN